MEKIGEGSYAKIYKTKIDEYDDYLALKVNIIDKSKHKGSFYRELSMLEKLRHPNIVEVLYTCDENLFNMTISPCKKEYDSEHLFLEYANRGDLYHFVVSSKMTYDLSIKILQDILLGVEYMHFRKICHGDIKTANILIFQDGDVYTAKLADLGFSFHTNKYTHKSTNVGTSVYKSPELCLGFPYHDEKSDMWSLGCVLYEMITKREMLSEVKKDCTDRDIITEILKKMPYLINRKQISNYNYTRYNNIRQHQNYSNDFNTFIGTCKSTWENKLDNIEDLLLNLLAFDKDKRISASDCLKYDIFDQNRKNELVDEKMKKELFLCKYRNHAYKIFESIYLMKPRAWYSHSTFFYSLDIFDRFFKIIEETMKNRITNEDVSVWVYGCILFSCKYYHPTNVPSILEIIPRRHIDRNKIDKIIEFESKLLIDVFHFIIYENTLFDLIEDEQKITNDIAYTLFKFISLGKHDGLTVYNSYKLWNS